MNNVRTVSDTKRAFYTLHTRPINTIYRRVVEELMVEMHLLSVNVDFSYNPIYALGVVTAFERFMQGYYPEKDSESIFKALCQSIEDDPQRYRQDAEQMRAVAQSLSPKDLISWLRGEEQTAPELQQQISAIASNPNFKYSRLFAIGIFTLLELADSELVKNDQQREQALKEIAQTLHISEEKLSKDLELYRANLEKMAQAMIVMADILTADRKKRQRASVTSPNTDDSSTSGTSPDKTSS